MPVIEYVRILNIPQFWLYTSGSYHVMVPNISGFYKCLGYTGFRICMSMSK